MLKPLVGNSVHSNGHVVAQTTDIGFRLVVLSSLVCGILSFCNVLTAVTASCSLISVVFVLCIYIYICPLY
jgi:hypothetical protein